MTEEIHSAAFPLKTVFPASSFDKNPLFQTTLASQVDFSGIGLFTGENVKITISPEEPNRGILFQRVDLPDKPVVPARLTFVKEAPRCTRLVEGKASIFMVEHLLSALHGLGIDNARVAVEGPEIPAGDGSASPFVALIERAGICELKELRKFLKIDKPVYWSDHEVHLVALPGEGFTVSYTMHYPNSPLLGSQYYSFHLNPEKYKAEIAPSRTFSIYEEILPFIEKGIIKGGGLENALVIQGDRILNPEGARFSDEMVRHKVLDLIGDLALIGRPILGHIISIRSGHQSNAAFAKVLLNHFEK